MEDEMVWLPERSKNYSTRTASRRILNLPPTGFSEAAYMASSSIREGKDNSGETSPDPDWSGGGFGCIFKDKNDKVLHQDSSNRSNVGSALVAEALAVKDGLKAARSWGLCNLIIQSDSKSLILAITTKEKILEVQRVFSSICFRLFLSIMYSAEIMPMQMP
ncbi:hypothetical protein HID58_049380 [Brassica napus]|uniref:RNase H type-1 domain-containing protein n=1 Tax=Brassica napus TaxID=3708 RepID=A0ABQ8B5L7_BRANA|nr:hypothetical protein HID58_049380 [Brassica napus]